MVEELEPADIESALAEGAHGGMRFARPPDGFRITCAPDVQEMLATEFLADADFARYWGDVVERLRFTAHHEGRPEPRLGAGLQLLAIAAIP